MRLNDTKPLDAPARMWSVRDDASPPTNALKSAFLEPPSASGGCQRSAET